MSGGLKTGCISCIYFENGHFLIENEFSIIVIVRNHAICLHLFFEKKTQNNNNNLAVGNKTKYVVSS